LYSWPGWGLCFSIFLGPIPALGLAVLVLTRGVFVYTVISVVKLAKALGFMQAMCAILMFISCVSLITLLVLNGKATVHLREAGVRVGLLEADLNTI
jgi:hypothetical protein